MFNRLYLCILIFTVLSACSDKNDILLPPIPPEAPRGMYIVNEGNFQRGNASLSLFLPDSGQIFNNIFQSVNGRPLGDVGYSITLYKGRAYVVVNNSDRIEVIDQVTHKLIKSIICPPGSSPRGITFDEEGMGYISNLYTNNVSVYDDENNTITKSIAVGANPDGIIAAAGHVFVANSGFGSGNTVSVISVARKGVMSNITVGDYPTIVRQLDDNIIGILCVGAFNDPNDPNDDTGAALVLINTDKRVKADSIPLPGHPRDFAIDDIGNAYILEDGVTRIDLARKIVYRNFISGNFYSAIVDTVLDRLYFTNAVDYVQPGSLEVYDYSGKKLSSYPTGVIPAAMVFIK